MSLTSEILKLLSENKDKGVAIKINIVGEVANVELCRPFNINPLKTNFGEVLKALKKGGKAARAGWNGKGMFLYYVPANKYPASRNTLETMKGIFEDDLVPYQAYIAMKTVDNTVVPWLASQTDMLADDWIIIE